MEENIMNNVEENFEEVADNTDIYTAVEETSDTSVIGKVILIGGSLLVAGYTAYKNRDKLKNKRNERYIRKLKKQGYKIIEPEIEVVDVEESDVEEVEEI